MTKEQELINELQEYLDIEDTDNIALYQEEVQMIIEALEEKKNNTWISVDDRLPETDKNRKYLVCGKKGSIYIAEFVCNYADGTPLGMSWWTAQGRYCPNPIAWMPLPEPYKETL